MTQDTATGDLDLLIDRTAPVPLYRQVFLQLRDRIARDPLFAGARLPSTRQLATDLGVSRTTIEAAYDQLGAEGFIDRRIGAGSFVLSGPSGSSDSYDSRPSRPRRVTSQRGADLARLGASANTVGVQPFVLGVPALTHFPTRTWQAAVSRRSRRSTSDLLDAPTAGHPRLRASIARHLAVRRGMRCDPEQVVVLPSAQMALDLSARLLADPGDDALVEDPGFFGAVGAFRSAGLRLLPAPVDEDGARVPPTARSAKLAYVTPAHQFPTGGVLSLERRRALIDWAHRAGAWIIEDDYDGEFRYSGPPRSALASLDEHHRTVYVGTFSKTMFPALRLAYVVLPTDLVAPFVAARRLLDGLTPALMQAVLADFIDDGHYGRHLRRMTRIYAKRQHDLVDGLQHAVGGVLRVRSEPAGLHLIAHLDPQLDDRLIAAECAAMGLTVYPLSGDFWAHPPHPDNGLVLGYAACDAASLAWGVDTIRRALERAMKAPTARDRPAPVDS